MRVQPISPTALVDQIAEGIAAAPRDRRVRVAVDGAPAASPGALADELVAPLRRLGREVLRVSAHDFLRPASLRFEFGRDDPDVYYTDWLDVSALTREVLAPLAAGGTGSVLPALWDAEIDRAHRVSRVDLAAGGVVLLDGSLLLGIGLDFDFTVHLALSAAALERRTPPRDAWTLPAYARYEEEVMPTGIADVVVRGHDPRRPALVIAA